MTKSLVFAHRGANKEAAENTRSAFDKALEYPIDGIETDVQLSRDEIAVLWHDRFLGKVGLPTKHIDDFDHAQLQAMNFAAHFSSRAKPEGIMSLKEFLDSYRNRCRLLLEIKNREWESSTRHGIKVRQTLNMVKSEEMAGAFNGTAQGDSIIPNNPLGRGQPVGAASAANSNRQQAGSYDRKATNEPAWVLVSSFNLASLVYAHQYAPGFPLVYNFETDQTFADAQRVLMEQSFLHGLCLPIESLDEAIVKLLRDHGKCIAVYTCNSDAEISLALKLGVDILISDVPQKALQMRDR